MKLIIMRTGGVGDVLLLRPALWQLRQHKPDCEIILLAPKERGLLAAEGLGVEVRDSDSAACAWLHSAAGKESEPPAILRGIFASNPLATIFSAENQGERACLERLGAQPFFFEAHPQPGSGLHSALRLWQCLAALPGLERAVSSKPQWQSCPPIKGDAAQGEDLLRSLRLEPQRYLLIHPGSGGKRKNWPLANFAKAASLLREKTGLAVLVAAGEAEGFAAKKLASAMPGIIPLPALSLATLANVLHQANGYLGNDSGISHLAALSGTAALSLFSPSDPALWSPVGRRSAYLSAATLEQILPEQAAAELSRMMK